MIRFRNAHDQLVWLLQDAVINDGGEDTWDVQVIPFKNPSHGFTVVHPDGKRFAVRVTTLRSLKRRPVPSKSQ